MPARKLLLAIDIGNTHTVLGVFRGPRILADWRLTSSLQRTGDEVGIQVRQFLETARVSPGDITRVGISSVVPDLTDVYAAMVRTYFRSEPLVIDSELDLGIRIRYDDPKAVGADRLCNAVAGFAHYGGPLIIIDFGTATTYDVVASNGDYLGGVIAPGIETSAADLHRRAARLPKIGLQLPSSVIGTDTVSSMQAGILLGAVDSMEGMVRRIQAELARRERKPATVIATGGFSSFISRSSRIVRHVEPTLVLEGIRLICDRVNRRGKRAR